MALSEGVKLSPVPDISSDSDGVRDSSVIQEFSDDEEEF